MPSFSFFLKKCDSLVVFFHDSLIVFLLFCSPTKRECFAWARIFLNHFYACRFFFHSYRDKSTKQYMGGISKGASRGETPDKSH